MIKAFCNAVIYTGEEILYNHCVVVENGVIQYVCLQDQLPSQATTVNLQDCILTPAFIDLQIYGGNGKLFGEYPSVEALAATEEYCRGGGAALFLPAMATHSMEVFLKGIEAVRQYWLQGGKAVPGLHLEGPYINPAKKGAHIEAYIKRPTITDAALLIEKGKGIIKMITLAPEMCSREIIPLFQEQGIIVSCGHTNATYAQAMSAFDDGITTATHLYNAMSGLNHREPGVVGAILDSKKVSVSIVADGQHVSYAAIRIAKEILKEKLFLITDAVTPNSGQYNHQLSGDKYVLADGTLSGSSLTMIKAVKNCIEHAGIKTEEALRMASLYPAKVIAIDNEYGKIKPGYMASFVVLDKDLVVKQLIAD